jgi:D-lactate dehydrogenase
MGDHLYTILRSFPNVLITGHQGFLRSTLSEPTPLILMHGHTMASENELK